jgi:hypothetical protein
MTPQNAARRWITASSLIVCCVILVFLLAAPAFGYPLEFAQSLRLLEILAPVFFGYLGAATLFVFRSNPAPERPLPDNVLNLLPLLTKGPIYLFAIVIAVLLLSFGRMNSPGGAGMSVDELAVGMSVALGLLTVTSNVIVAFLFGG